MWLILILILILILVAVENPQASRGQLGRDCRFVLFLYHAMLCYAIAIAIAITITITITILYYKYKYNYNYNYDYTGDAAVLDALEVLHDGSELSLDTGLVVGGLGHGLVEVRGLLGLVLHVLLLRGLLDLVLLALLIVISISISISIYIYTHA